jgi:ribosomal-protein-alanine N-acetyltransferase
VSETISQFPTLTLPDGVAPIGTGDIRKLRMPWDARFSADELYDMVGSHRFATVWNQRTGEYVVAGRWRHRAVVATILETAATGGAVDLFHGLAARAAELGFELIVASEQAERRRAEFYAATMFEILEDIVVYELPRIRTRPLGPSELRFTRFEPSDRATFDELIELDHRAFPWMWWNSRDEFVQYFNAPGVAIDVGRDADGEMVAYVGMTRFRSWGHLDRIAVSPELQGQGVGRIALDYAVTTLANGGARRVGLSTQARNTRSRRLYESYGFRRSTGHDYRIYGRWLKRRSRDDE